MQYLMSQGVSQSRMRTVSYGKERPIEACAEQRCWDVNRRAVTAISGVSS
jgi:peptidoglycan-associated lipoprotein